MHFYDHRSLGHCTHHHSVMCVCNSVPFLIHIFTHYPDAVIVSLVGCSMWACCRRRQNADAHLRYIRDVQMKASAQNSEFTPVPQLPAYTPRPPTFAEAGGQGPSSFAPGAANPADSNAPQVPPPSYSAA